MFGENQRLHMARLSVPKDNRRRERFNGTQNTMFQTFNGEIPDATQLQMNKTVFNGSRKGSTGSFVGGSHGGPRVKSSLLGTSARQKLLKYRLEAHQAKVGVDNDARAQIIGQIAEMNKTSHEKQMVASDEHLKTVNVNNVKDQRDAKKSQKERILE